MKRELSFEQRIDEPRIDPGRRAIRASSLPLWRLAEIGAGITRAALLHRLGGLHRLPILHSAVKVRRSNGTIEVGHLSEIHERVVLSAISDSASEPARILIGDRTSIWYGTVISARHEISIGRECAISWNCTIIDNDMHEIINPEGAPNCVSGKEFVKIGDHVWIGASAIVLKGVTIGENSIVAAGAIVTQDVPAHTLVAGIPAKPIRQIGGWR
jgi:acetyltransferase-like isoleucine patch superfamily enzyme